MPTMAMNKGLTIPTSAWVRGCFGRNSVRILVTFTRRLGYFTCRAHCRSSSEVNGVGSLPPFDMEQGRLFFSPSDFQITVSGAMGRRTAISWLWMVSKVVLDGKEARSEDGGDFLQLSLELYMDEKEGFVFQRPVNWTKVQKAGANVLFEDPKSKDNSIGVVVNPVRITSLKDFGSPDTVANKLLQAEMKKSTTNNVELIRIKERQLHGDIPLYELEYKLDSMRGMKRVLSAVTVTSQKLYVLNISYIDNQLNPLSPTTASTLEQILESFDVLY